MANLKIAADTYLDYSNGPYVTELNSGHSDRLLQVGTYLLKYAQDIVDLYKTYQADSLTNSDIRRINTLLGFLEFDKTDVDSGEGEMLIYTGWRSVDYRVLLSSGLKKDITFFNEIILMLNYHVKSFLDLMDLKIAAEKYLDYSNGPYVTELKSGHSDRFLQVGTNLLQHAQDIVDLDKTHKAESLRINTVLRFFQFDKTDMGSGEAEMLNYAGRPPVDYRVLLSSGLEKDITFFNEIILILNSHVKSLKQ